MSEYQFYEFRAIDKLLDEDAQAEIAKLSSRVEPSPTSAVFTYSYSDFRGDPIKVLMEHYDIMLYMTNWGTRQIAFRLPQALVDPEVLKLYLISGMISVKAEGEHLLLDIVIDDEEGSDEWGWIEGEGWMGQIAPVREELLRGDYRVLYLAWLAAVQLDPDLDELTEPPVPPNLGKLSRPLKAFADFLELDPDLIAAAAQASGTVAERNSGDMATFIAALPESERNALLLRVAEGDPHVGVELVRRLNIVEREQQTPKGKGTKKRSTKGDTTKQGKPRTVAMLMELAAAEEAKREKREAEAARKARIRELEKLEEQHDETWLYIVELLKETRWKAHQEAVDLLVDLRDLAEYRQDIEAFESGFSRILQANSSRVALMKRFRNAGLVE